MTLSANYKPIIYTANGVTTSFSVTWKFFDKDISVTDETGDKYDPSLYKIFAGQIVFHEPPAKGKKVIISRDITLEQDISFIEGNNFPAEDYENALDRIYMILQSLGYDHSQFVRLPDGMNSKDFTQGIMRCRTDALSNFQEFSPNRVYKEGEVCLSWWYEDYKDEALEQTGTLYVRVNGDSTAGVYPRNDIHGWHPIAITSNGVVRILMSDYYSKTEVDTHIDHVKLEFNAKIGQIDDVLDAINGESV